MNEQTTTPAAADSGRALDEATIAQRAYEISQADGSGTPEENWARAEAELRDRDDRSEPE